MEGNNPINPERKDDLFVEGGEADGHLGTSVT
jgi:hypothetical protein